MYYTASRMRILPFILLLQFLLSSFDNNSKKEKKDWSKGRLIPLLQRPVAFEREREDSNSSSGSTKDHAFGSIGGRQCCV